MALGMGADETRNAAMIRKIITAVILVPLAAVLIAFAVANRQLVTISFDPFSSTNPAYAVALPLFVLIFVLVMFGIIVGGTAVWLGQMHWRWAARHAGRENRELQLENDRLKRQLMEPDPAHLSPPLAPPASHTRMAD